MIVALLLAAPAASSQPSEEWRLLPPAPIEGRAFHSAVWTGEEMIVWGGSSRGRLFADGAAFDPDATAWRPIADAPLAGRTGHSAVWTGQEILVWGGCCQRRGGEFGDGAAYDPSSNEWRMLPPAPILPRRDHTTVWTGRHMIVWGGAVFERAFADGAMYSPRRDRWLRLPDAPVEARYSHAAVWTGSEMIVWGGATLEPSRLNDGGAFGRGWSTVAREGPGRSEHTAVWSGTEMLVWGGCCRGGSGGQTLNSGSAYEPTSDTWRSLPDSGLAPRVDHLALPSNGRMVIWGGVEDIESPFSDGAMYDPIRGTWFMLPPAPLDGRSGVAGVWTGDDLMVWGGCCDPGGKGLADGGSLLLGTALTPSVHVTDEGLGVLEDDSGTRLPLLIAVGMMVLVVAGLGIAGMVGLVRARRSKQGG